MRHLKFERLWNWLQRFLPHFLWRDPRALEEEYSFYRLSAMLWFFLVFNTVLGLIYLALGDFGTTLINAAAVSLYLVGLASARHRTARWLYTWAASLILVVVHGYFMVVQPIRHLYYGTVLIPSVIQLLGRRWFSLVALATCAGFYVLSAYREATLDMPVERLLSETTFPYISLMMVCYLLVFSLDLTVSYAFRSLSEEFQRRQVLTQTLVENHRSKDQILSILSHDLKGSLTQVTNMLYLMRHNDYCVERDILEQLSRNTFRMSQTLQDVLDWAGRQWQGIQPRPTSFRLKHLMEALRGQLQEAFDAKGVTLGLEPLDATVHSDFDLLVIILRNLFQNGLKFTHPGGRVWLEYRFEDGWQDFRVCDNGVGIPPEKLPRLFEASRNRSTRGTDRETGTGLGLVICKQLVDALRGNIGAQSRVGEGSEFLLRLPVLSPS